MKILILETAKIYRIFDIAQFAHSAGCADGAHFCQNCRFSKNDHFPKTNEDVDTVKFSEIFRNSGYFQNCQ